MGKNVIKKRGLEIPFSGKFYTDLYYVYKDDPIFSGLDFEIVKNFSSCRASYILSVSDFVYEVCPESEDKVVSYLSYRLDGLGRPIVYFAYTVKDSRNKGYIKRFIDHLNVDKSPDLRVSFIGSKALSFGNMNIKFMRCGV